MTHGLTHAHCTFAHQMWIHLMSCCISDAYHDHQFRILPSSTSVVVNRQDTQPAAHKSCWDVRLLLNLHTRNDRMLQPCQQRCRELLKPATPSLMHKTVKVDLHGLRHGRACQLVEWLCRSTCTRTCVT
jgi:hypothetical protein